MKWFGKKREEEPEFEVVSSSLPVSNLVRWFLYDTELVEPNEIAHDMGLTRVSEEGDVKEKEDSDKRLEPVGPLIPFLTMMSEIASQAMCSIQEKHIDDDYEDAPEQMEKDLESMYQLYKVTCLSALISAFSSAMELGLIFPNEVENLRFEEAPKYDE